MQSTKFQQKLISIRRHLHQYPEIGYQEHQTSEFICEKLTELGVSYRKGLARGTGILAEIRKGSGQTVLLRADMDALPMQEISGVEFSSQNPGVMHACGHDMHTTMLLGAIEMLQKSDFNGTVKFVFQPSEEGTYDDPDKKSGGQRMVEEGVLDGVDCALALHVNPLAPVGMLNYTSGTALANAANFTIEIFGKSGHAGAAPHLAKDTVLAGSALVQQLQTIVARNIAPLEAGVVSVAEFHAGSAPNVIADFARLTGTLRALSDENFDHIQNRLQQIIKGIELAYEVQIKYTQNSFYPGVKNDAEILNQLQDTAEELFPLGLHPIEPTMGAEDFAFFAREVPSAFYFIGAMSEQQGAYFLHHPKVIFNEDCLVLGAEFLAKGAINMLNYLNENNKPQKTISREEAIFLTLPKHLQEQMMKMKGKLRSENTDPPPESTTE